VRWPPTWEFASWKTVQLVSCSEIGDSHGGPKAGNTEVEGSTALETVTRQRLVKI
jgi:hypothetical protein